MAKYLEKKISQLFIFMLTVSICIFVAYIGTSSEISPVGSYDQVSADGCMDDLRLAVEKICPDAGRHLQITKTCLRRKYKRDDHTASTATHKTRNGELGTRCLSEPFHFWDLTRDMVYAHTGEALTFPENVKAYSGTEPVLLSFMDVRNKKVSGPGCKNPVPNIVHVVWFKKTELSFLNFISFLGIERSIKPDYILMHGDVIPSGHWWTQTLARVPNLYHVKIPILTHYMGHEIKYIQHVSDIYRLQILSDYGGIYMDSDVLPVASFDPLRCFEMTGGSTGAGRWCNAILLARRAAPFIRLWMEAYRNYNPKSYGYHSLTLPGKLQKLYPQHIHVEREYFFRPNVMECDKLVASHYDWSRNYAVHVWRGCGHIPNTVQEMNDLNSTLGEIMRHIYYGSKLPWSLVNVTGQSRGDPGRSPSWI